LNMALEQTWEALRVCGNEINRLSPALENCMSRLLYEVGHPEEAGNEEEQAGENEL